MARDIRTSRLQGSAFGGRLPVAAAHLTAFLRCDELLRRQVSDLFYLMPGARDVFLRLSSYLLDLPSPSSSKTALELCVRQSVASIVEIGLHPYSVRAHSHGLGALVSSCLDQCATLLPISVVLPDGRRWDMIQGPISSFLSNPQELRAADIAFDLPFDLTRSGLLRPVILAHLLSRSELIRLSPSWADLVRTRA